MKRTWLGLLLLPVVTVTLTLVLLEAALRILSPQVTPNRPRVVANGDLPELHGVFELARPNVRGTFKGILHETNSFGLRDRDYAIPKPAGISRVVIIGDSFTMGSGVSESETYAARIEEALGPSVEVVNLGLSGLDTEVSIDRLERIGVLYEPDLVVYGWTINDLEGKFYRKTQSPVQTKPSRFYLGRFISERWNVLRDLYLPSTNSYMFELDENYFRNPEAWGYFRNGLHRLRTFTSERGICGVVFLHTILHHLRGRHPMERYYDAVAKAAAEEGLAVVPSLPAFRGKDERSLWVDPLDPHPNAEGHALLADALLSGIRGLPERCRFPAPARGPLPRGSREVVQEAPVRVVHGAASSGFTLLFPQGGRRVLWLDSEGRLVRDLHLPKPVSHVEQLPNGNLLALSDRVVEFDPSGRVVWDFLPKGGLAHHEVRRATDGTTFTIVLDAQDDFWADRVVQVNRDGAVVWEWKALEHIDRNDREPYEHQVWGRRDWLHTNSIDFFPDGDLLLSFRNLNRIARIDYPSGEILWSWGDDVLAHQHTAKVLDGGRVLIFDNGIYAAERPGCREDPCQSRAIEIELESKKIVWEFKPPGLFSLGFGNVERLANGNTVVTFGQNARRAVIIEVDPDGHEVWRVESQVEASQPMFGGQVAAWLYRSQRVDRVPGVP